MDARGHLGLAVASAAIYQYEFSPFTHSENIPQVLLFLIFAAIGGKAPDWDMLLIPSHSRGDYRIRNRIHRQTTHSLLFIVGITLLLHYQQVKYPMLEYAVYFMIGVFSHIIGDLLTGTIPIFLYGDHRKKFRRVGIKIEFIKQAFVVIGRYIAPILVVIGTYQMITYNLGKNPTILEKIKIYSIGG